VRSNWYTAAVGCIVRVTDGAHARSAENGQIYVGQAGRRQFYIGQAGRQFYVWQARRRQFYVRHADRQFCVWQAGRRQFYIRQAGRQFYIGQAGGWKFYIRQAERLRAYIRHAGAVVAAMMVAAPTKTPDRYDVRRRGLGWHSRTGKSLSFKRK
jgi:hypothetical protein